HRFIKAVGAGVKRARDLTREEAREAMTLIATGAAEPVQVGAFLLSLRMKGESADELAGFVDALTPFLRAGDAPAGALDVDCHGAGHEGRPSLRPAAAAAVQALGVRVVLRTDLGNPLAKHGLRQSLATVRVPVIDLASTCPPLHALVS